MIAVLTEEKVITKPKSKKDKTWKIELREDWCKGCYLCIEICPIEGVFMKADQIGSRGFQPVHVNPNGCIGCLLCELLCPDLAITVEEDETHD
jgi:2-oxoglutarate ferredoxin oxidoreductase subunit delta